MRKCAAAGRQQAAGSRQQATGSRQQQQQQQQQQAAPAEGRQAGSRQRLQAPGSRGRQPRSAGSSRQQTASQQAGRQRGSIKHHAQFHDFLRSACICNVARSAAAGLGRRGSGCGGRGGAALDGEGPCLCCSFGMRLHGSRCMCSARGRFCTLFSYVCLPLPSSFCFIIDVRLSFDQPSCWFLSSCLIFCLCLDLTCVSSAAIWLQIFRQRAAQAAAEAAGRAAAAAAAAMPKPPGFFREAQAAQAAAREASRSAVSAAAAVEVALDAVVAAAAGSSQVAAQK